ncbi:N-acetyltransferase [bacterium]|nr:N-acetyltransferase [bacterium]
MEKFISNEAKIGSNFTTGYFVVVEDGAIIGDNVRIGHNVIIHADSVIGSNVAIGDNTVIGKLPMKAVRSATTSGKIPPAAEIGDDCTIGTNVVIYRGAKIGNKLLIADLATIREAVSIGDLTIVGRGVTIENECRIGKCCKLETNSYITAYSELGDYVFISPCVATSNDNFMGRSEERFKHFKGVTVKTGGRIGANSTILPGKVIKEDSMVGAGSVVTKDTIPGKIVLGNPAREFKEVPEDQLLKNQGWEDK